MSRITFTAARPSGTQALAVDTKSYGLTIVQGIEGQSEASMASGRRIGFLRETNFGQTFEVVDKADPNNQMPAGEMTAFNSRMRMLAARH